MSFIANRVKGRLTADSKTLNWVLLALSLLLTLSMAALLGSLSGTSRQSLERQPSTFFTDDSGLRAAFLAVRQFTPAMRWRSVLMALPPPSAALDSGTDWQEDPGKGPETDAWASLDTLVVARPSNPLSPREAEALQAWVEAGGQAILCLDKDWPIRGSRAARAGSGEEEPPPSSGGNAESGNDSQDSSTQRGFLAGLGLEIALEQAEPPASEESGAEEGESQQESWTLMLERGEGGEERVVNGAGLETISTYPQARRAAWKQLGRGRLVVITDPWAFSNQRLSESSNAVWLVQAAAGWGSGRTAFDEVHHGFIRQRGLSSLLLAFAGTPWGWACLQMLAALLAYLLLFRSRFGRRQHPPAPRRSSPLQWIDARAGLLQAAGAGGLCAQWMHRSLALRLSRSLGYSVDLDQARFQEKFGGGDHPRARLFQEYMRQWRALPQGGPVPTAQLDGLARAAGQLTRELKARQ